jgi:hypothetical protein
MRRHRGNGLLDDPRLLERDRRRRKSGRGLGQRRGEFLTLQRAPGDHLPRDPNPSLRGPDRHPLHRIQQIRGVLETLSRSEPASIDFSHDPQHLRLDRIEPKLDGRNRGKEFLIRGARPFGHVPIVLESTFDHHLHQQKHRISPALAGLLSLSNHHARDDSNP